MDKIKVKEDNSAEVARDQVAHWKGQIESSLKREKEWRKDARSCVKGYEARRTISFNMLYSNTETLGPALYSSTPKPAVMRRYKNDDDKVAKEAAEVLNRSLNYQMDTNGDSCSDFDDLMDDLVLAALVPGRGQVWYRYEPKMSLRMPALPMLEMREDGQTPKPQPPVQQVEDEYLNRELVPWDLYTQGFARQWKDVPWVARCHILTKDELIAQFKEHGGKVTCAAPETFDEDRVNGSEQGEEETKGAPPSACVWEIWDKVTRKVWFIAESYADAPLLVEDDPLGLSGFFPCPKPLIFTKQLSGLIPQTLYAYYKEQAEELETVSVRLRGLIRAMRIRGMYSALIDDIARVLDAEENTLIPITNAAAFEGGLKDSVWLVPIKDYVPVIQELWMQREQLKKVIYELTGISDIIRGSTVASETATAQDIKSKWGTLRLQTMQKRVQKYARTMLRIESEIMCKHFDQKKFQEMTDMELPTNEQKQQVQDAMAQTSQVAQMNGQPPEPPDPQVQKMLALPSWEEVLGFLKNNVLRSFRLDIETDSTLAESIRADQEEVTSMLTGVTQLIQGLTPAVQGGFLSFETAKGILVGVVRRFRLGSDLEGALDAAQAPPPPAEEAGKVEAQKAAVEQQKMQMQQQQQQQEMAMQQAQEDRQFALAEQKLDMEARQMEMQLKKAEMDQKMAFMQQEFELKQAEHAMKLREMELKADLAEKQVLGKLAVIEMQTQAAKTKAEAPAASKGE